MAPHSSTLAWNIPPEEEPGRLQSMWSIGVGHNWATSLSLFTFLHWRRKWPPTPVFLPGESRDGGAWWAAVSGVTQSRIQLKRLSSNSSSSFNLHQHPFEVQTILSPISPKRNWVQRWSSLPKVTPLDSDLCSLTPKSLTRSSLV